MMLFWYFNRLKTFSIPEIGYRIRQIFHHTIDRIFFKTLKPVPAIDLVIPNKQPIIYPVFTEKLDVSKPIDWHKDLASNKRFPKVFAHAINMRDNRYGSAKNVWEINRMLFMTDLAWQYSKTKEIRFVLLIQSHISSWVKENPYVCGINWHSNIEVNIRLINWYYCWQLLDVENLSKANVAFDTFVRQTWLPSIYQHCRYSYQHPSLYSSANNHLIAEYAGLFVASQQWRFKESGKWNKYAKAGLEREIRKQHSKNGINREETAEYIQFITDFFLVAYLVGQKCNNSFSSGYKDYLYRIFSYITQIMDTEGNSLMYGDGDDGYLLKIGKGNYPNNFLSLLATGAVLFNESTFKHPKCHFDEKANLLLGDKSDIFDQLTGTYPLESGFYPDEGHFIFRNKNILLHFDAAPLGYLSIAAHGHADALSFILHVDGKPVIVDSGTYTYHTHQEWRKYFAGTLAHNTICVDHENQAKQAGPTLWLKHYNTKTLTYYSDAKKDFVMAEHNGYNAKGLNHTRSILFDKEENIFEITDEIEFSKQGSHFFQIPLHLHPVVSPVLNENSIRIRMGKSIIDIMPDKQFPYVLLRGSISPILGWYSEHFGEKEACSCVLAEFQRQHTFQYKTVIKIIS
ncbi:MAG: heparinase II/III family protein [Tannerellaceae bacterium]|jgi:hypothetical protein|nr:heparinase II/III family protein [Tannerellaceae bacterium]